MIRLRLAAAGALATAVTVLTAGAAQAAYPDCGIALSLSASTVTGGQQVEFTADAGEVDCSWTVRYAGQTRTGSGTSLSGTFDTVKVNQKTATEIVAECEHAIGQARAVETSSAEVAPAFYSVGTSTTTQAALSRTCPISATITLLPAGADLGDEADGVLPDTGGSNLWILVLGGALVVGGAGVTYAARRRARN